MIKLLTVWAIGGLFFGVAVAILVGGESEPAYLSEPAGVDASQLQMLESRLPGTTVDSARSVAEGSRSGVFADRLTLLANANATNDRNALITMARSALSEPMSLASTAHVEILLGRLFEIDPEAAVSFIQSVQLPTRLRSSIYRLWTEFDSETAIDALNRLDAASEKRRLALAIIDVVGPAAIDDIVAELPALGSGELAMAALVQRATKDPLGALQDVPTLASREAQEIAMAEIGRIAGALDPEAAIEASDLIADVWFKPVYLEALYTEWSLNDLPRFFEYLGTVDPRREVASFPRRFQGDMERFEPALANAAESDPERLLEFGREAGGELGVMAEAAALMVLSAQDPTDAINYFDSLSFGYKRDELAVAIASGYARYDIEAALSWATQVKPPLTSMKDAVLQVLAETDLAQAIRFEVENPTTMVGRIVNVAAVPPWFRNTMTSDLNDPGFIADQIAAADAPDHWKDAMLPVALSRWASDDPNAALVWLQNYRGNVTAGAVQAVAEAVVPQAERLDVDRLIDLGAMLNGRSRGDWISRVVGNAAASDPNVALAIVDRYREDPSYDAILTSAIRGVMTNAGPEAASRLLGPNPPPNAAMAIAGTWALEHPSDAAQWAAEVSGQEARATAVSTVVVRWSQVDVDAATEWARSLPDRGLVERAMAAICNLHPEAADCG